MKRPIIPFLLSLVLALSGCAPAGNSSQGASSGDQALTVVATTYPVYLFASAVTAGVEGVAVQRLNTGETSCLHDYTLSVDDMKKLEGAGVIAMNGAGLEDFMEDALAASNAAVIDCSQGVELLEALAHSHEEGDEDGHDHGHWDPHYWMDPDRAVQMIKNLQAGLTLADAEHAQQYRANAAAAIEVLDVRMQGIAAQTLAMLATGHSSLDSVCSHRELITFHDGFQYFAQAFGLNLLASIEEEAGSEASAKEILEISELVREYGVPAIFTEVNGSDATARAISRETGCGVYTLDMIMGGEGTGVQDYQNAMIANLQTIAEALK